MPQGRPYAAQQKHSGAIRWCLIMRSSATSYAFSSGTWHTVTAVWYMRCAGHHRVHAVSYQHDAGPWAHHLSGMYTGHTHALQVAQRAKVCCVFLALIALVWRYGGGPCRGRCRPSSQRGLAHWQPARRSASPNALVATAEWRCKRRHIRERLPSAARTENHCWPKPLQVRVWTQEQ